MSHRLDRLVFSTTLRYDRTMRFTWITVLSAVLLNLPLLANPLPPNVSPSDELIKRRLSQLADADPEVREQARYELLGLGRTDLPRLRDVVAQAGPLVPSQSVVLREVVIHVFLSGEPFEQAPGASPFLGITMVEGMLSLHENGSPWRLGVTVGECMPGFAAYRVLREGDVILALEQNPPVSIHSPGDLVQALGEHRPGDTVHLRVLRGGNILVLPVVLGPRPLWAERFGREDLLLRQQAAQAYWHLWFAPLVERPMS